LELICASNLVVETSQEVSDVPYGDYFKVEVQFISFLLFLHGYLVNSNASVMFVLL